MIEVRININNDCAAYLMQWLRHSEEEPAISFLSDATRLPVYLVPPNSPHANVANFSSHVWPVCPFTFTAALLRVVQHTPLLTSAETISSRPARYCPTCKNDTSEVVKAGEKLKASKKKAKMPSATTESQRDWGKVRPEGTRRYTHTLGKLLAAVHSHSQPDGWPVVHSGSRGSGYIGISTKRRFEALQVCFKHYIGSK